MSLIKWNDSFSVNVVKIDQEHKKLVAMVNDLTDAMKAGKGKDVLGKILDGLIAYTASHFQTEEQYFRQVKYPYAEEHKKEHAAFVRNVLEFKKEFDESYKEFVISELFLAMMADDKKCDVKP